MADNANRPKEKSKADFMIDSDHSSLVDVPTITRLLNRKKIEISGGSSPSPGTPPEFQTAPPAPESAENTDHDRVSLATGLMPVLEVVGGSPAPQTQSPPAQQPPRFPQTATPPTSPFNQGDISLSSLDAHSLQIDTLQPPTGAPGPSEAPTASQTDVPQLDPLTLTIAEEAHKALASTATGPIAAVKIQPAKRRGARNLPQLIVWDVKALKNGADPLGKGLAMMLEKGVTHALFLSITTPPPGSPVPHFLATASVMPQEKREIWKGLKWDPTVVPEFWNFFIKAGYVDLVPPGVSTNIRSNRNVVRHAFGVKQDEWLLLVRAGPANACRGVLALISKKSILTELAPALPLISALPPTNKAA